MAKLDNYKPLINKIPAIKCSWEYRGINYSINNAREFAQHCVRVLEYNRGNAKFMCYFHDLEGILKHFRLIER